MMESKSEIPQSFEQFIKLGQALTPQEAIETLAVFHNATPQSVINSFTNLRGFNEGTVIFRYGLSNSDRCIVIEGSDATGKWKWNHLIDLHTGQPIMRTS